jgi:hypothetical protein
MYRIDVVIEPYMEMPIPIEDLDRMAKEILDEINLQIIERIGRVYNG